MVIEGPTNVVHVSHVGFDGGSGFQVWNCNSIFIYPFCRSGTFQLNGNECLKKRVSKNLIWKMQKRQR